MTIQKETEIDGVKIRIIKGDITESDADAIVNAANSYLQHGGGVAGAIVRKGGNIIQEESDRIGYVPVGEAAITGAGTLKAQHVIHAVGPRWGEGNEEGKLRNAVRSTLSLAAQRGIRSVAMPAISAGIFGFPKKRCAEIMVAETAEFVRQQGPSSLQTIDFYLIDEEIIRSFDEELSKLRTG